MHENEARSILARPNGTHLLLDLAREGRIDSATVARMIDLSTDTRRTNVVATLMAIGGLFFHR